MLGDLSDDDRGHGMGVIVEYAGRDGDAQWAAPPPFKWDYRLFAPPNPRPSRHPITIEMLIEKRNAADNGFNVWTINGTPFSMDTNQPVSICNATSAIGCASAMPPTTSTRCTCTGTPSKSPMSPARRPQVSARTSRCWAVTKAWTIDFVADQPGLSLLHCHQQIHMDYGLMLLLKGG